jgi:DNA replication protein DnaC
MTMNDNPQPKPTNTTMITMNTTLDEIANRFASLPIISDDELANAEQAKAEAEALEFRKFEKTYGSPQVRKLTKSGFGRREAELVTNANFQTSPEWQAKYTTVCQHLKAKGTTLIAGDCGTGKTVMACLIASKYQLAKRSVVYTRAIDFFRGLKSTYRKDATQTEAQFLDQFEDADLLIIDEIQDRSETNWENSLLNNIIDHRYSNLQPTILLTNQIGDNATATLPRSIISRITGTGAFVQLDWNSLR